MSFHRYHVLLAAALAVCPSTTSVLTAQDSVQQPALLPQDPGEEKLEPTLLQSLRELESKGFVHEGDRILPTIRVIIEIRRQPGDPTFADSVARDPVPEVLEGVGRRQVEFLQLLDARLERAVRAEIEVKDVLSLQYMVVAEVRTARALRALGLQDAVKYVFKDHCLRAHTNEGRVLTGSTAAALGNWTGNGVGVAVIDTRFDLLHAELGGSTTLPNGVVAAAQNFADVGQTVHSRVMADAYHGTATASIVRRYAARASLYCLTVFPAGDQQASDSAVANAINWCVINRNGRNGGAAIKVVSMSLGRGREDAPVTGGALEQACSAAVSNGILCLASSGNDGYLDGIGIPAACGHAISVGATWDATNCSYTAFPPAYCQDPYRIVDERTCYSNTAGNLDFYAPSEEVICARVGGGLGAFGGTSAACPAAAGLLAQFLQARPTYAGYQVGVESLFASTGSPVTGDSTKRRVHVMSAIQVASNNITVGTIQNGVTYNYSMLAGGVARNFVTVPPAFGLQVQLTGTADADLYVKRAPINWPADRGRHDEPEFKAPFLGGSNETVTFATLTPGTWNLLVHAYSGNPSGTLRATWIPLLGADWRYRSINEQTPHPCGHSTTYSRGWQSPGASFVGFHFSRISTERSYDHVVIRNAAYTPLFSVSGDVVTNGAGQAFGRSDGWCIVPGDSITAELITDYSIASWGFQIDQFCWFAP